MYSLMPFSDVQFNIGNDQIKCHKALLAAHSDAFIPLVKDAPEKGVDIQGISSEAFSSLLRFIYYGEDTIEALPACELVGFSRKFKLHYMLKICEDKIRNSVSQDTALAILQTTYLKEMEDKGELVEELRNKAMPYIVENLTEIDLTPIRRMHPNMPIDILEHIQKSGIVVNTSSESTNTSTSDSMQEVPSVPPPPPRSPTGGPNVDAPPPPPRNPPTQMPAPNSLPPPMQAVPSTGPLPPPSADDDDDDASPGRKSARGTRKVGKVDAGKKVEDPKKKKEDEKKKKDEEKRVAKEKKEKEKADKKTKPVDKKKKDL